MSPVKEKTHASRASRRFVPNMAEDVISFSECRNHLADCFKRVSKPNKVLFVTQNGRPTAFLANVRDWNDFVEYCAIRDDVAAAEAELDRGEFTTQEEEIRAAHAERERIRKELAR